MLPKFYNIIGESLTVYRGMTQNGTIDDSYRFTLKLSSNADLSNLQIADSGNIILKLKDIFYSYLTFVTFKHSLILASSAEKSSPSFSPSIMRFFKDCKLLYWPIIRYI